MRTEFWNRNAWKFLLGLVAIIGLFGIGDVILGLDADPGIPLAVTGLTIDEIRSSGGTLTNLIDLQVRAGGVHLIVMSAVWAALVLIPFRRGERWAWFAMWTFPLWAASVAVAFLFVDLQPDTPPPPPAISGWIFLAVTVGLLWSSAGSFAERSLVADSSE
jgi:hypothetical protein